MTAALWAAAGVVLAILVVPGSGLRKRGGLSQVPRRRAPAPVPVVEIASALELLALAMRSGCGVVEALDLVGGELDDVCGQHLRTVAAALRWGLADDEAWGAVSGAWRPAAQALALATGAGVAPADLLVAAAADIRRQEEHRLETAATRLAVQVVLPLGLTFLPAFVAMTVIPFVLALTGDLIRL